MGRQRSLSTAGVLLMRLCGFWIIPNFLLDDTENCGSYSDS